MSVSDQKHRQGRGLPPKGWVKVRGPKGTLFEPKSPPNVPLGREVHRIGPYWVEETRVGFHLCRDGVRLNAAPTSREAAIKALSTKSPNGRKAQDEARQAERLAEGASFKSQLDELKQAPRFRRRTD